MVTFEEILDRAYEKSLTLDSGVKGLQRNCWFKRNRAEFLALGADFAIGSVIYAVVLSNPYGIAALAGAITARKLTSEGYDYYKYQSSLKALKKLNQSTEKLTDIETLLEGVQVKLLNISDKSQQRLETNTTNESKKNALSYLASLNNRFKLETFKSKIVDAKSKEDKLFWINYLEDKINTEKKRIIRDLENPQVIQATFKSKTKQNLTEALKVLTELSNNLDIYKANLPNELPLNKLIEAQVNAIFSQDLTNPAKLSHVFEQMDSLIVNLQGMIDKQKSDVSVYTQSLLNLKKQIDQSTQSLGDNPSDQALINHFAYIFQYYSVYAELLETVILPYDASFYLTSLLQSKIETLKDSQTHAQFEQLMKERQKDQLAEPKLFQLRKWQFHSKNLPKIEKAYLYLCEITGIPPVVGSDTGFWLSNIADPVVESLIRFTVTIIAHHPEYTELLPLAVDAIQSGHFLNGGFEALSGVARLSISLFAEHHFHSQREKDLQKQSPELLYHFTMSHFHALDLIYKDQELNLSPLNEYALDNLMGLLKIEKQHNINENLSSQIGLLMECIDIQPDKDGSIFMQHKALIKTILSKMDEVKEDLKANPKNYGGEKIVAPFINLLEELTLKYQSAQGIYQHFEASEKQVSIGSLKAQKRADLVQSEKFQQTLTDGLLFNMGESFREQTVSHLSACRYYLWHVFNGKDVKTENANRTDKYKLQILCQNLFGKLPQYHEAFTLLNSTMHQQVSEAKISSEEIMLRKAYPDEVSQEISVMPNGMLLDELPFLSHQNISVGRQSPHRDI
ncbi:hypothetical protein L3V83_13935 [Thiotrichales bacterium 19X7-9]|nr:hypothetical protein [Thiotrichales bacterium 19X7-9]